METKIKNIIFWIQASLSGVLIAGSVLLMDLFKSNGWSKELTYIILLVLSLFLIRFVVYISNYGFRKSLNIRKFLSGKNFIEGYWIDIVRLKDNTIREYAIIEIEYEIDQLKLSGILYNTSLKRIGSFKSGVSRYSDHKIEYGYSRLAEHEKTEQASGLGEYNFTNEKPYPLTFNGSFFDSEVDHRVKIEGVRINSERHINLLETKNVKDQIKVLNELINMHFKS